LKRPSPPAARTGDATTHGGVVGPVGVLAVTIGGSPAAVAGDMHFCPIPPPHPTALPFAVGSSSVRIGGRGALRVGDRSGCGAAISAGCPRVTVGG
jgi:uncharacterized Zn-binding protein involved in type VI secretion